MKHDFRKRKSSYRSKPLKSFGQDHGHSHMFTRRALLVGGLQASLLGVLGGRLAWLQLVEGQKYRVLSDKNRINVKIKAPSRGQIIDRFGVPLATNERDYRLIMIPEQAGNMKKSLETLREHIALDDKTIEKTIKKAKRGSSYMPVEIHGNLQWEDVARVEVNITDLPGIQTEVGERRIYPYGKALAHVVGYTASVNDKDLEKDSSPVLRLPGFKIGRTGVEKRFDLPMRGETGNAQVEVNVLGREVRELQSQDSVHGKRIGLTLDADLQQFVYERLSAEVSASAVIMNVHNGEVYALASHPTYDPNIMSNGIPQTLWDELMETPGSPMTNKTIAGQYPPASTFKMITALAALKAGVVTPTKRIYCPGHYEFKGDRFHCWKGAGHGNVNVHQALAESCDVFFYELSTEIGIENIAKMAREFGLGEKSGIDLFEDHPGLVPDKAWKNKKYDTYWKPGETINASIGQGYTLATPLQLAVMTSRMVNGGYAVQPHILMQDRSMRFPKMDIDSKHMAHMQKGMDMVVNHDTGTARGSRIEEIGMEMGGKTGTAQVQRITMAQRRAGIKNEDLEWKRRHHALFCGYAPVNNPRYACSVVVEHGVGGSKAAAPIARDLLYEAQKRGKRYESHEKTPSASTHKET